MKELHTIDIYGGARNKYSGILSAEEIEKFQKIFIAKATETS